MDDRYYASANQAVGYPDQPVEVRPLEEIRSLVEELGRINHTVSAYLERFNGPRPDPLAGGAQPMPPQNYRTDLDFLRNAVRDAGQLADQIARLG